MLVAAALLAWLSCTAVAQTNEFRRLSHNGRVLEYALILPDRSDARTRHPVLLALPGRPRRKSEDGCWSARWLLKARAFTAARKRTAESP
jgi:dipeptidyl aminopeptidase/acylaminoacyl peptidase